MLVLLYVHINAHAQPFNGYVEFDGVDDVFTAKSLDLIPTNSDFTVEFWLFINEDSVPPWMGIMGTDNLLEVAVHIWPDGNWLRVNTRGTDGTYIQFQPPIFNFECGWTHIAITFDEFEIFSRESVFTIYFNGVPREFSPRSYVIKPSEFRPFYFGRTESMRVRQDHLEGFLDEIRFSDTIRYLDTFVPIRKPFIPDNNTLALYHFDDDLISDASDNKAHLTVSGNPTHRFDKNSPENSGDTLFVRHRYDSYHWIDCETMDTIEGATDSTFIPDSTGSYAVVVSHGSCADTLECIDIEIIPPPVHKFQYYPNPTDSYLMVNRGEHTELHLKIYDCTGKLVLTADLFEQLESIDLSFLASGVYVLQFEYMDFHHVGKIIRL